MAALYRLTPDPNVICRVADGAMIPTDTANRDYNAYLVWRTLGNNPDPAPVPIKPPFVSPFEILRRLPEAAQIALVRSWLDALVTAGKLTTAQETTLTTP